MRILLVDDESEIRKVLHLLLTNKGHDVLEAYDGEMAVRMAHENSDIDLCIMDIMMPKMSGVEATVEIRKFSDVPVLFLTAKSLERDKMNAYSSGGDDYIVKPFSPRELLMKVDALTRRYNIYSHKETDVDAVRLPYGIILNPAKREVIKNGEVVDIRDKEFEVFAFLVKNRGKTVSAKELYEAVWQEISLPSSNNTVTVHILNLRRKLEDNPSSPKLIRTVWGKGYEID
jgi:DNA-binding response OmpR family regulator